MKRFLFLLIVAALCVSTLSVGAFADSPYQLTVRIVDKDASEGYKELSKSDPSAKAKVFLSGGASGACNKKVWTADITVRAEVAQWVEWNISATQWTWLIRKPGEYFADCVTAMVKSNGSVTITFAGFNNLKQQIEGYPIDIEQEMSSWFSYGDSVSDVMEQGWISAAELNGFTVQLPDNKELHEGKTWKLWNKVLVEDYHSVGVFENTGTITLSLGNIQPWIDERTGDFKDL